ncbi:MAG: hypothetical protein ACOYXT_12615 [Bacteroidota bacterium]
MANNFDTPDSSDPKLELAKLLVGAGVSIDAVIEYIAANLEISKQVPEAEDEKTLTEVEKWLYYLKEIQAKYSHLCQVCRN